MVKIIVEVTNRELDTLEDLAVAWNLCKKHNAILNATEKDRFRFTEECKKCRKKNKEISNTALHVWSKLATAYEKAKKRRRKMVQIIQVMGEGIKPKGIK